MTTVRDFLLGKNLLKSLPEFENTSQLKEKMQ